MALHDSLFDTAEYVKRMRATVHELEKQLRKNILDAIVSPTTDAEERKQLADMLIALERKDSE